MDALDQIATEAVHLAAAGGVPILAVLGLVIVLAFGLWAAKNAPHVTLPRPPPEVPAPPAVWDSNVEQNTDPNASDSGGG